MDSPGFIKKTVDVENRSFQVQLIRFENGNFVSVSEGSQKIGSMVVSISSGPATTTTTVIPAKTDSLFLKLTAEQISAHAKGISIVSMYTARELGNEVAKVLLSQIMEMVRAD